MEIKERCFGCNYICIFWHWNLSVYILSYHRIFQCGYCNYTSVYGTGNYTCHNMYKSKKIWSVFVNIPYQLLVFILGMLIMTSIVATYKDPVNNWFLQEPFSQALVLTALDAVFVLIKNLLVYLFRKK